MSDEARIRRAARRYGPSIDHVAKQYGIDGATLLVKLAKGESGFSGNRTSSAGARGWTQFMPATRADYVKRYGVDPWASPEQAIKATSIYLKNAGNIAAYNPGMASYTDYILKQDVGKVRGGGGGGRGGGQPQGNYLVVGDSLGVGTAPFLKRQLGNVSADVRVGRSSQQGLSVLRRELASGKRPDGIILDLGTNDGSAQELQHTLRRAQQLAGGVPVYVPTVHGRDAAAKNQAIKQSGVNVLHWDTPLTDNVHSANYQSRAKQLVQQIVPAGGPAGVIPSMSPVGAPVGGGLADILRSGLGGRSGASASIPAPPSFAAGPVLAGQSVPSGGSAPSGAAATTLASRLAAAQSLVGDLPNVPVPTVLSGGGGAQTVPQGPGAGGGKVGHAGGTLKGAVLESFYNGPGGVNTDSGKLVPQGFVSGHTDHVHFAADTHADADRIGRIAQKKFGLTVRELAPFDTVDPVHVAGSFHYRGLAGDVSGDPARMRAFSRWVAKRR